MARSAKCMLPCCAPSHLGFATSIKEQRAIMLFVYGCNWYVFHHGISKKHMQSCILAIDNPESRGVSSRTLPGTWNIAERVLASAACACSNCSLCHGAISLRALEGFCSLQQDLRVGIHQNSFEAMKYQGSDIPPFNIICQANPSNLPSCRYTLTSTTNRY